MRKTQTRRALLTSVLALVLCVALLASSTYAWFTDSATVSVNKIQSGKLDIQLLDAEGNSIEGKALAFKNVEGKTDILWEPGCTYELQPITIKNAGNLACKYEVVITGINGDAKLNEAIEWEITDSGNPNLFMPNTTSTVTIKGHMKEDAGDEYQDLTIDGIAITVVATQVPFEKDSKDDQYDKDAEFEMAVDTTNKVVHITSADALLSFAAAVSAGELKGYTAEIDADIDLAGKEWTPINHWDPEKGGVTINGNGHTISNMTINASYSNVGFFGQTSGKNVIKDLTFENASVTTIGSFAGVVVGKLYGNDVIDNVKVINSTVTSTAEKGIRLGGLAGAAMIHDGAKAEITNCTVSGVTVSGYHNVAGLVGSLMNYDSNSNWKVEGNTVENSTVIYANGNPINSDPFAANGGSNANPVIPNNTVKNVIFVDKADLVQIATADELFDFAAKVNGGDSYAGKYIVLTADIDLENEAWTPIGQTGATQFLGTFDGQGYTISNLKIVNNDESKNCSTGLFGWIERHGSDANYLMAVKNVNIDGATVEGHHNVAVIAGYLIGTIENCHVTNATITNTHANDNACGDKAGVIAGIAAETNAVIKNCTAADSTVTAGRDAGQIVGACIVGKVENCSATNVTVAATGDCTGNNINNAIIGRTN